MTNESVERIQTKPIFSFSENYANTKIEFLLVSFQENIFVNPFANIVFPLLPFICVYLKDNPSNLSSDDF